MAFSRTTASIVAFLLAVLLGFSVFIQLNFGKTSVKQIQAFLSFGSQGINGADFMVKVEFALLVVTLPILFLLSLFFTNISVGYQGSLVFLGVLMTATLFSILSTFSIDADSKNSSESYRDYRDAIVSEDQIMANGSSIVHIFVEGMPPKLLFSGVSNTKNQDLLIDAIGESSIFGAVKSVKSGGTIAGMASSMCGTSFLPREFSDRKGGNFLFSQMECISDVTFSAGYSNLFLGAASGDFQSKREFLEAHNVEVLERSTWLSIGSPSADSWGQSVHDDRILSHSRAAVNSLVNSGDRFYVSVLTLDTHYPYYLSDSCLQDANFSSTDAAEAYECSTQLVVDFIGWLNENLATPTLLVIQGDHAPGFGLATGDEVLFLAGCLGGSFSANSVLPSSTSEIRDSILEYSISCR